MTDFTPDTPLWGARLAGALAGSAISLVYLLPRGRREAASRFFTGLAIGLIFGGATGQWLARKLDILQSLSGAEIMLAGATLASLSAWWALGALARFAGRYGRKDG
ncbi:MULTISPECIES: DUF6107 family protein [Rhizobium/Agrobacterium group]|uniref:Uncharacterized protein n=2 Tax=Rhizobium/Agrobacterium group TaxID=227290 RepID=B9JU24_ALLAM|nr:MULTISPECIES: DUF6107 family protein [Rhizobium/Agrobacterium group]ACM35952.1 hypothetical protein Avi_1335 [Allorhizobium ampelinum S4]MCF1448251.1 hypothetical protein [Allorhizobium ampelinum]MCF1482127.1 hypothetical protein [Allorhizobium ampelinum]MCF1492074.1 hypothetical protein [Allorhizobium ampelinum]MUO29587.1 hypothetical protein [Agrobacterium vitis]